MLKKIKNYFDNNEIVIEGRNALPLNSDFNLISSVENPVSKTYDDEQLELIKKLEKWLGNFFEKASMEKVNPIKVSMENGKLKMPNGTISHRTSANIEMLRAISKSGVMATEWFGVPESAGEGALCSFVSEKQDFDRLSFAGQNQYFAQVSFEKDPQCVLYFDNKNVLLQNLLEIDYFQYEYLKKHNPEKIEEIYPKFFIDLFEKVIGPKSPSGKTMRDNNMHYRAWKAIPGGIPAFFINGICISSKGPLVENVGELAELFPKATIFNEKGEILNIKNKEKEDELID